MHPAEGKYKKYNFYLVVEFFDLKNVRFSAVCEIQTVIFFRAKNSILGFGLEKLLGSLQ